MPVQAVVGKHLDRVFCQHTVGEFQEAVVVGAQCGRSPAHCLDFSGIVTEPDAVSDFERLLDVKGGSGEKIAEGILQGEANQDRNGGRCGDKPGHIVFEHQSHNEC